MKSRTFRRTFPLFAEKRRRGPIKRLSTIFGISLLIIVASLTAQAQGRNSPPLVVHFSGTDTVSFFDDCTGETIAGDIAFAGVLTQTITNPGGALEQNHFDMHVTVMGTAIGQTTGIQYVTGETVHDSQAGTATFPFIETFTANFRFVSKGGSSNLAFSETFHLTITATGETAVTFDNVKTFCQ
jgi:hypothetical protein